MPCLGLVNSVVLRAHCALHPLLRLIWLIYVLQDLVVPQHILFTRFPFFAFFFIPTTRSPDAFFILIRTCISLDETNISYCAYSGGSKIGGVGVL